MVVGFFERCFVFSAVLLLFNAFSFGLFAETSDCKLEVRRLSKSEIIQRSRPLFQQLVHDGLNPAEALGHIFSMVRDGYHEADQYISSDYNAADRIASRWSDTLNLSPSMALKLLPGLILILQNKFNVKDWIDQSLRMPGDANRLFFLLRYLNGWIHAVDRPYVKNIFLQVMEKDDSSSGSALALYFDLLLKTFANDPNFLKSVFRSVGRYNDYLGIFASSSPEIFDGKLKSELIEWRAFDKGELITDRISLARFGVYVCGSCDSMQFHREVFLNSSTRHARKGVLIFLRGFLVAGMKRVEAPSILGLRNIQNSKGHFPLLVGGVYSPTTDFLRRVENNAVIGIDGWARIDVDYLNLEPIKFLDHHRSAEKAQATAREIISMRSAIVNGEANRR